SERHRDRHVRSDGLDVRIPSAPFASVVGDVEEGGAQHELSIRPEPPLYAAAALEQVVELSAARRDRHIRPRDARPDLRVESPRPALAHAPADDRREALHERVLGRLKDADVVESDYEREAFLEAP